MPPASRACAPPCTEKALVRAFRGDALEHGKGFLIRGPARTGAFPRGEGGSRRLTDEVSPGEKPCGVRLCGGPMRCAGEEKSNESRTHELVIRDIVFIMLEILACRSYVFCFEHFILSCFSNHIRENSWALRPHPPLTRSPFSEHGEGFFRGPLTGMPPASRAARPRARRRLLCSRSRTHQSLPPRGRCRACEADEVPPGVRPCSVWICYGPMR